MKSPSAISILAVAALLPGISPPLAAAGFDPPSTSALVEKEKDTLVSVHVSLSSSAELIDGPPGLADAIAGQPPQTDEIDCAGVVVHGNGTVAIPVLPIDPGLSMGGSVSVDSPLGKLKLGIKSTVTAAKIVFGDGSELAADLILKDAKSGLALLRAKTPPAKPLAAVTLSKETALPSPFAPLCILGRLDPEFGRETAAQILRAGVVTPAPSPLLDLGNVHVEPGLAAFDDHGRFLGMTTQPARAEFSSVQRRCVVPASEILRIGAKALK